MLKLVININATTEEEIGYTLEEVLRKIKLGNEYGMDSREDGINKYDFDISGEESLYIECTKDDCNALTYYENEKPTRCLDCGESF